MTPPRRPTYDAAKLAMFAEYRDHRVPHRPAECNGTHDECWVELGPAAMPHRQRCAGCGGMPTSPGYPRTR